MAAKLLGKLTPEIIGKVFETLPSGTRVTLGQYGTPAQWTDKLNDPALRAKMPAGMASADPGLQIEFLVSQVVSDGKMDLDGPRDPAGAAQRFAQLYTSSTTPQVSPVRKAMSGIEELIAENDKKSAGASHFLNTRPLGG